ncbi:hypothetical protein [Mycobacterium uberis]|uniref:hypothetical protein n=1 Tax=Mycobacterium uberis TaxID=2162698 RepID=UPI000E3009C4|nr:hypothetical protein [Mycobacterium uberis]
MRIHWTRFGRNRDRDVVFVDQRGMLHSNLLLSCPELDHSMDDSAGRPIQPQSMEGQDLDAVWERRTRLYSNGYDLSAYNTTKNAANILDLRTTLNIGKWTVYGMLCASYLAFQLHGDRPEGIHSVVRRLLVSATD